MALYGKGEEEDTYGKKREKGMFSLRLPPDPFGKKESFLKFFLLFTLPFSAVFVSGKTPRG